MTDNVDDFLAHYGVPGMKWGKRKASGASSSDRKAAKKEAKANKPKSAGKLRDIETKAARKRLNEGKNVFQKIMNADSFGKPLGGKSMLSLMNKGSSPEDIATASRMTRGQKVALGVGIGVSVAANIALRSRG